MKVAIVDDSKEMLEIIRTCVIDNGENIVCECNTFQKARVLLDKMAAGQKYDLYFLDIKISDLNGIELAKKIRELQSSAYIVFLTSYTEFALESYDLKIRAYHYIMKDNMKETIPKVLIAIYKDLEEEKEDYYIIQNKFRYEKVKNKDIMYIYKENKNSVFVTQNGICKERKALSKVIKLLGRPEFLFVDPGRIVNIRYIRRIEGNTVYLTDETRIYASQTGIKKLKKEISNYWRDI